MWRTQNKINCHKALCHVTTHMRTHILYLEYCSCSLSLPQRHSLRWQLSSGNMSSEFPLGPFPWRQLFPASQRKFCSSWKLTTFKLKEVSSYCFLEERKERGVLDGVRVRCQHNVYFQNLAYIICVLEDLQICIALSTFSLLVPTHRFTVGISLTAPDLCHKQDYGSFTN